MIINMNYKFSINTNFQKRLFDLKSQYSRFWCIIMNCACIRSKRGRLKSDLQDSYITCRM